MRISHVSRLDQEGAGSISVGNGDDAHHLPGGHTDGLDGEPTGAHVE